MASHKRALPGSQLSVDLLDKLVFLGLERSDFTCYGNRMPRFAFVKLTKVVDLLFKRFNIMLKFEKNLLGHPTLLRHLCWVCISAAQASNAAPGRSCSPVLELDALCEE